MGLREVGGVVVQSPRVEHAAGARWNQIPSHLLIAQRLPGLQAARGVNI